MLISFKSKSSPEVLMYQEHAERILQLLNKNPKRGVITPAEANEALRLLEQEVEYANSHPKDDVEHDVHAHAREDGETTEHAKQLQVGFHARAFPLLEMLRSARQENEYIMWGV